MLVGWDMAVMPLSRAVASAGKGSGLSSVKMSGQGLRQS